MKGPLAEQSVDELMGDVQMKCTKLEQRMHYLDSGRQYWISRDTESSVRQNGLLLSGQANIKSQVDDTAGDVKGMVKDIQHIFQKTQEMHAMMQQERDVARAREATVKKQVVCNRFMALFYDSHRKPSKLQEIDL